MTKDIFLSHAWGYDQINRDNHKRCIELYNKLSNKGFFVWIDESDMRTNIDHSIMDGIDNANVVLICLTKKYCDKINYSVYNNMPQDNCYKEWNYCIFRKKYIIPVIMEEEMKNIYIKEKGVIQMYLNNILYVDASINIDNAVEEIIKRLKEYNLNIHKNKNKNKSLYNFNSFNSFNFIINSKINSKTNSKINSKTKKFLSFFSKTPLLESNLNKSNLNKNNNELTFKYKENPLIINVDNNYKKHYIKTVIRL